MHNIQSPKRKNIPSGNKSSSQKAFAFSIFNPDKCPNPKNQPDLAERIPQLVTEFSIIP